MNAFFLVLVSFLTLYFEVVLIRWIPGNVRIVNYFTNLVLIANFLGIGIGCASASPDKKGEWGFLFRLALLLALCLGVKELGFLPGGESWGESYFGVTHIGIVPVFVWAILVFFLTAWVQIPLGRILGRHLGFFPPLMGYSLNLLGSIAGVSAMAIFNFLRLGPVWWFGLGLIFYLPFLFLPGKRHLKIISLVSGIIVLYLVWLAGSKEIWSPYYKIKLEKSFEEKIFNQKIVVPLGDAGYSLTINDNFFQFALNLSPQYLESLGPEQAYLRALLEYGAEFYNLPYQLSVPEKLLILGAGTGNDVAMANRFKVPHIDAVEIDPVIAELGILYHPEHPYQNPAVHLFIDDARHFLKTSSQKYDMIIYGLLDSQRLVSYISIVRQDNFVYTYEGIKDASERLKPGGILALAHVSKTGSPQSVRLFQLLEKIFPGKVIALKSKEGILGRGPWHIFIVAPESIARTVARIPGIENITQEYRFFPPFRLPTDDWPFLYLSTTAFWKTDYFKTLLILLLVSFLFIIKVIPESRQIHPHFFLLGAGFLLLETKSIIEMSILFGSTWIVNAVVISAFLAMALLANLAVYGLKLKRSYLFYLLLLGSLGVNLAFPVKELTSASIISRVFGGGALIALPVLFSGIIFALSFQKVSSPARALGANLLGAILGGFLEYSSLFTGYQFLYLLAGIIYLSSWIFVKKK